MTETSDRKSKIWSVIRVSSGNFLEMYDFMVFGYYATAIGNAFFPGRSPFLRLMLSLMTFGAGFLMRPLGAIVLGAYTDKQGRRSGLLLTLGLMSIGIFFIACMPGYATIGLLAPLLVLIGRLLQGFSAGMELGGVSVYLSEIATPGHKGFYVSWQSGSQQVAVMFAALIGVLLNSILPPDKMAVWDGVSPCSSVASSFLSYSGFGGLFRRRMNLSPASTGPAPRKFFARCLPIGESS
jgi:MFS family permease